MSISITVLVENAVARQGLLAEHGLACWIEYDSQRLLFDTGQGMVLAANARRLEIALHEADAIILSHGHYDHTGGLAEALHDNPSGLVFAHPDCLADKYTRTDSDTVRDVGLPAPARRVMMERVGSWVKTCGPQPVVQGLIATGPVPRLTDFEDTGGSFFLDPECREVDPLVDDQALFFDTPQGVVVLLGCAHAGVINTLQYIRQLTGNRPIHSVMGGMHLVKASSERLQRTIEELRRLDIQQVGPAHCTGSQAVAALWNAFPQQCFDYHVGTRLEFESL